MNATQNPPLTSSYIDTVLRKLPEDSRDDIAQDLSGMISDLVDARSEAQPGSDPAGIERDVLTELGDPAVLAQRYSGRPRYLIGPEHYPVYIRMMTLILPIVAVLSLLANAISYYLTAEEPHIGALIGVTIGKTVVPVLAAFAAITLLIGIGERVLPPRDLRNIGDTVGASATTWSVDDLDTSRHTRGNQAPVRAEAVLNIVMLALLAVIPLLTTPLFYIGDLNSGETFVNPDLPTVWLVGYWALLAVLAGINVWNYRIRRLTAASVASGILADAVLAVLVTVAFLTQDVLHPGLAAEIDASWWNWAVVTAVWVIFLWDQINTVKTYRQQG
ncbi:MAG: HAAS signaling domain-containing protein [Mycobacteriaceae bacterium]|uniref:HAAS signaling domain-containing protein n=1 Tax=Corynebacterium sp. TaxID=1720 RepID=UPI003F97B8E0